MTVLSSVVAYAVVTLLVGGSFIWILDESHDKLERRKLSRYALASPLWPVLLVMAIYKGIRFLIIEAGIGLKEDEWYGR